MNVIARLDPHDNVPQVMVANVDYLLIVKVPTERRGENFTVSEDVVARSVLSNYAGVFHSTVT
jgi:hypothetical protein